MCRGFFVGRGLGSGRALPLPGGSKAAIPLPCPTLTSSFSLRRKQKPVADSFVIMTELVLPNDTNTLNNRMGGRMMHLMDIAAAISAQKHSNRIVVTASVDNVSFRDS